MLSNLLLSTLLTNGTYLGYHKRFTNSRMLINLAGRRKDMELHNLNSTVFSFQKALKLLTVIWSRFSCLWVIAPRSKLIYTYFVQSALTEFMEDYLYFWYKRWSSGFLTNYSGFASMSVRVQYPSALFYTNYTQNRDKFVEAEQRGILTVGIADSNSLREGYNFLINANEKSSRSYLYFVNIIFSLALRTIFLLRRDFLII
jgi:ribosomal protein S2